MIQKRLWQIISFRRKGDNRNDSKDSRYWKNTFVRFDQIVGKAVVRYYPSIKLLGNEAEE